MGFVFFYPVQLQFLLDKERISIYLARIEGRNAGKINLESTYQEDPVVFGMRRWNSWPWSPERRIFIPPGRGKTLTPPHETRHPQSRPTSKPVNQ
jgi:hypothetical protein